MQQYFAAVLNYNRELVKLDGNLWHHERDGICINTEVEAQKSDLFEHSAQIKK